MMHADVLSNIMHQIRRVQSKKTSAADLCNMGGRHAFASTCDAGGQNDMNSGVHAI